MKFLIDAHFPYPLSSLFIRKGLDCIHTDDLPNKERTSDDELRLIARQQNRIVITKDTDFLDSYHIRRAPQKLLLITTGNLKNNQLYKLFSKNFNDIIGMFKIYNLVEMNNLEIIGHE